MPSPVAQWFERCRDFIVSGGNFTSQQIEYAPSYTSGFIVFQFTNVNTPQKEVGGRRANGGQLVLCSICSTVISATLVFLLAISLNPEVPATTTTTTTTMVPAVHYGSLPPPIFLYGHEDLVRGIVDAILLRIEGVRNHICLRGAPGIGKTATATTIMYEPRIVHHFGNARHWIWCQEASNTPATLKAEKILEYIADALGIELKPSSDRKKDIRFFLNIHSIPRIIVFDNFETVWDPLEAREAIEGILQFLAQFPQVTIVVTTRNGHNPAMDKGVTWYNMEPVQPLSLDASRRLFTSLCHPRLIDNSLDDLLHAVDYIPFIIILMATYAQENYTTSQILEIWRRRLLQQAGQQDVARRSDQIKLDNCISMSLDGPSINSTVNAPVVLRIIAELPGGVKKNNLQKIMPGIPNAHEIAQVLVQASLLVNTPDTLRMHSYIRAFMLSNYPLALDHNTNVHDFYFRLIHDAGGEPGDPNFLEHNRRLQYEEINAEAILMDSLNRDFGRWAPIALDYSNYQIWNNPSINTTKAFVDLIRKHAEDSAVQEVAAVATAESLSWPWRAYQWIMAKPDVSPGLSSGSARTPISLLPLALLRLGKLYYRRDMYSDAIYTMEDAITESRSLHQWNISAEALKFLGDIYRLKGVINHSLELYSQACKEFDRDTRGISSCLRGQGICYFSEENISAAIKIMDEARKTCFPDDYVCIADCDRELGRVYRQVDPKESLRLANQSREHYLVHGPLNFAAISLYQMSIALYLSKRYDEAEHGFARAIVEFQTIVNDAQIGYCNFHLGEMNYLRGTLPESLHFFRQSETIFAHMENDYMAELSRQRQTDIYTQASAIWRTANEIYESASVINARKNH